MIAVLAVTGIKDGVEDYRRYKQDSEVNSTHCLVYCKSVRLFYLLHSNFTVDCGAIVASHVVLYLCMTGRLIGSLI